MQVKLLSKSRSAARMIVTVDVQQGKVLLAKDDTQSQKFSDVYNSDKGDVIRKAVLHCLVCFLLSKTYLTCMKVYMCCVKISVTPPVSVYSMSRNPMSMLL